MFLALALLLPQDTLEASLQELFKSLTEAQRAACLKAADDPNRNAEEFTPGRRPGLLIRELSTEQLKLLEGAIGQFLSEAAFKEAMKVARQSHPGEGLKAYYLNFFGDPTKDKSEWAFRVSEHHLTLVHVESDPDRFGPILLGANPPELWRDQEDAAIECFRKLSDSERKRATVDGRGMSGRKLGDGRGVPISELSAEARAAAAAMIEARFKLFSEPQQKKLRKILASQGGVDKLRLAFFGEMTRRCADGGRADWKIEGPDLMCDYESSRGHLHMTLRGTARTLEY